MLHLICGTLTYQMAVFISCTCSSVDISIRDYLCSFYQYPICKFYLQDNAFEKKNKLKDIVKE